MNIIKFLISIINILTPDVLVKNMYFELFTSIQGTPISILFRFATQLFVIKKNKKIENCLSLEGKEETGRNGETCETKTWKRRGNLKILKETRRIWKKYEETGKSI